MTDQIKEVSATILIIDDDPVVRITIQKILEKFGYTVRLAENGRQGLELFLAEHSSIDLVILDHIMPEMNGKQVFDKILSVFPETKIIIMSGFTEDQFEFDIESEYVKFLQKPANMKLLKTTIEKLLHQ